MVREGSLVEDLAAGLFLATAVVAGVLWRRLPVSQRADRRWMGAFGVLGLIFFLEEVGYGTRLVPSGPPVIGGYPIDGVHDLISIVSHALDSGSPWAIIPAAVVAAGTIIAVVKLAPRIRMHLAWASASHRRTLALLAGIVVLLAIASLIDIDAIAVHPHRKHERATEELLETNAACLLLLCCLYTYVGRDHDRQIGQRRLPG